MIDKQSPVPIYYQIQSYIKDLVDTNRLRPGDTIPSERELTEKFQVSRMTVRQAIMNLVNDGVLYRQKGKGTFVSEVKIEQPLQGLTSFTEDMKKRGLVPGTRLLSFTIVPADEIVADRLQVQVHEPVYEIIRIRLADEQPISLESTYLSANLVKGLTDDIVMKSLYSYIEKNISPSISYANQVIEASIAGKDEIEHLQLKKGSPILLIHRNTFLDNGQPLEWVKSAYRADRYKFVINMTRDDIRAGDLKGMCTYGKTTI
ncbi:MAG: GntR family transcriptional regulator [Tuberibacillus sp.]